MPSRLMNQGTNILKITVEENWISSQHYPNIIITFPKNIVLHWWPFCLGLPNEFWRDSVLLNKRRHFYMNQYDITVIYVITKTHVLYFIISYKRPSSKFWSNNWLLRVNHCHQADKEKNWKKSHLYLNINP